MCPLSQAVCGSNRTICAVGELPYLWTPQSAQRRQSALVQQVPSRTHPSCQFGCAFPPPPRNPPPMGATVTWPETHRKYLASKAAKKILQGAEADLHCDTIVQICGAIPPPLGGEPSFHDCPAPPLGGASGAAQPAVGCVHPLPARVPTMGARPDDSVPLVGPAGVAR